MSNKEVSMLKTQIAELQAKVDEHRGVHAALKNAKNHLAYLTANVFVVLEFNKTIGVCGVLYDQQTHAENVSLRLDRAEGNVVRAKFYLATSTLVINVSVGGQVSFELDEDVDDERVSYLIRAFSDRGEAEEWARRRRYENASH